MGFFGIQLFVGEQQIYCQFWCYYLGQVLGVVIVGDQVQVGFWQGEYCVWCCEVDIVGQCQFQFVVYVVIVNGGDYWFGYGVQCFDLV